MERLTIDEVIEHCNRQTERMENDFGRSQLEEKPMMGNLNIMKHYWEHRQVAKWLKELKEYRNLEEQCRLIKLPCKVGDIVYHECPYSTLLVGVQSYQITNIMISQNKKGEWTRKYRAMLLRNGKTADKQINFEFNDIGKTVFLAKEEAEKALEMEK